MAISIQTSLKVPYNLLGGLCSCIWDAVSILKLLSGSVLVGLLLVHWFPSEKYQKFLEVLLLDGDRRSGNYSSRLMVLVLSLFDKEGFVGWSSLISNRIYFLLYFFV